MFEFDGLFVACLLMVEVLLYTWIWWLRYNNMLEFGGLVTAVWLKGQQSFYNMFEFDGLVVVCLLMVEVLLYTWIWWFGCCMLSDGLSTAVYLDLLVQFLLYG